MKHKPTRREKKARTRMPSSPMSRFKQCLDVYEYTAADEILAAYKMAFGLPVQRDPDLNIPIMPRADGADSRAAYQSDLTRVYPSWRRDLQGTLPGLVVDAALFQEIPLGEIDETQEWPRGTARKHFATALKHFAALRGNTPSGARDWNFTKARVN